MRVLWSRMWCVPLVFLGALVAPAARADSFLFDFQVTPNPYINGDTVYLSDSLPGTTLEYVSGEVNGFAPETLSAELLYGTYYSYISPCMTSLPPPASCGQQLLFSVVAPFSAGVYSIMPVEDEPSVYGAKGTLTITEVTPEPGTWVMVGTGLLGGVGAVRRRLGS